MAIDQDSFKYIETLGVQYQVDNETLYIKNTLTF
jgi:hypothetical protein